MVDPGWVRANIVYCPFCPWSGGRPITQIHGIDERLATRGRPIDELQEHLKYSHTGCSLVLTQNRYGSLELRVYVTGRQPGVTYWFKFENQPCGMLFKRYPRRYGLFAPAGNPGNSAQSAPIVPTFELEQHIERRESAIEAVLRVAAEDVWRMLVRIFWDKDYNGPKERR